MVYSNRFVACVLINGIPQKEIANSVVPVAFGSEYSLRFRNKNNRRAVVVFTIDDENVCGNGYIIPANSAVDIHRHWEKDAKFKFVELDSSEAVDHGKNGPNTDGSKGVIKAKFFLEKLPAQAPAVVHHSYYPPMWGNMNAWPTLNNPYVPPTITTTTHNPYVPPTITTTTHSINQMQMGCSPTKMAKLEELKLQVLAQNPQYLGIPVPPAAVPPLEIQEGCTVEGSRSYQNFTTQHVELETDYVPIEFTLKGLKNNAAPVVFTVNEGVIYCTNCGAKKARPKDNFCGVCGHRL